MASSSDDNVYAVVITREFYANLSPDEQVCYDEARRSRRRYMTIESDGRWAIIDFGKWIALPGKMALLPPSLWHQAKAEKVARLLNAEESLRERNQHNAVEELLFSQLGDPEDHDIRDAFLYYLEHRHFEAILVFVRQGLDQVF